MIPAEDEYRISEQNLIVALDFKNDFIHNRGGPLCTVFVDRISERIADHNKEAKSQVKNHIRTRFRFDLLRSTLYS